MSEKLTTGAIVFGPLPEPPDWRKTLAGMMSQVSGVSDVRPCNCIGPQPGQTTSPCALHVEMEKAAQMLRDGVVISGRRYRLVPADQEPPHDGR